MFACLLLTVCLLFASCEYAMARPFAHKGGLVALSYTDDKATGMQQVQPALVHRIPQPHQPPTLPSELPSVSASAKWTEKRFGPKFDTMTFSDLAALDPLGRRHFSLLQKPQEEVSVVVEGPSFSCTYSSIPRPIGTILLRLAADVVLCFL